MKIYLNEMEHLKVDFSDLEDLDLEEIQEMQDAIAKVQKSEKINENDQVIQYVTKRVTKLCGFYTV